MPDLDIRETARQAALSEYSHVKVRDRYDADLMMAGFRDGAQWAVDQLPDLGDIAKVLRSHNLDELLLGDGREWLWYTAACSCGWRSGEYERPGEAQDAHFEHAADAVLALIRDRLGTPGEAPK